MKLFLTVKELYESSFINKYYHEIYYTAQKDNLSKNNFLNIQEKFSRLNLTSKTQVMKFLLKEGIDIYFFDFELNEPIEFSESDFSHSFLVSLSLETKLKIKSKAEEFFLDDFLGPKFYEFPFQIQPEEKYGQRARILLFNINQEILSEYFDPDLLKSNQELANSLLAFPKKGLLYFRSYEEDYVNSFLKSFEEVALHKKYRSEYFQFKVFDLILHLIKHTNQIKQKNQLIIKLTENDIHRIQSAKEFIVSNLENPPTIPELAKKIGVNELKLKSGFKQIFGTTIYNYIYNVRMEKAKYLLKIENKSVTEVSLEVGYSSLSKFANAFRKKYGVNPGFFKTQKNITNPKFPPGLKKIPEGLEFS